MSDPSSPPAGVVGFTPTPLILDQPPLHPHLSLHDADPAAPLRRSLAFDAPTSSRRRPPSRRSARPPPPDLTQLLHCLTQEVVHLRAAVRQGLSSAIPFAPATSHSAGGTRRSFHSRPSSRPAPPQPSGGGNRCRIDSIKTGAHSSRHATPNELNTYSSADSSFRPSRRREENFYHLLERQLDAKIQQAQLGIRKRRDDPRLTRMSHSPFIPSIASYTTPAGFVAPRFRIYDGRQDPYVHISLFRSAIYPYGSGDAQLCSLFPSTIGEHGLRWFDKLPAGGISSFAQLAEQFVARFKTNRKTPKEAGALMSMRRGQSETLREYNRRYWDLFSEIEGCAEDFAINSYKYGFSPGQSLRKALTRTPPTTLQELQDLINQEIRIEEDQ